MSKVICENSNKPQTHRDQRNEFNSARVGHAEQSVPHRPFSRLHRTATLFSQWVSVLFCFLFSCFFLLSPFGLLRPLQDSEMYERRVTVAVAYLGNRQGGTTPRGRTLLPEGRAVERVPPMPRAIFVYLFWEHTLDENFVDLF